MGLAVVVVCFLVGFGLRSGWLIAEDMWRDAREDDE
jgi:hypothetical protein